MTIQNTASNYVAVGNPGRPNRMTGAHLTINSGEGATRTLLQSESGSVNLFDKADGIVYTLPVASAAMIGCHYDFLFTVSITSNNGTVQTGSASNFLVGGINSSSLTAGANDFFVADGTSIVKIATDSTTKGGLIGGYFRVECISATVWAIKGTICGSGTLATPFA